MRFIVLFAAGCTASPSTSTGDGPGHTADPPVHTGGSTILDSGEPAGATMEVGIEVWEWDRQCWAWRRVQRPVDHWGEFYEDLCQTKDFEGPPVVQYHSYSDPGGHCLLYHGFEHTGDPERCVTVLVEKPARTGSPLRRRARGRDRGRVPSWQHHAMSDRVRGHHARFRISTRQSFRIPHCRWRDEHDEEGA